MSKVTCDMAMSVDGFVAGPNQSPDEPFGEGVHGRLHRWMFEEADAHADEIAAITAARAYVMGRNMFGPGRGAWDLDWKGWWGDELPYHAPVFVLSHHERASRQMEGGTTSTSSPTAPRRRSNGRARRPATAMSQSPAAPRPSTSTFPPA
jgi:dihydrofolate reductase